MTFDLSSHVIETDSFDRELFSELCSESKELADLIENGSRLLPKFEALALDLFASFYKYNIVLLELDKQNPTLRRKILSLALEQEKHKELREETVLDGFKSAMATVDVANQILNWLRSEEGPGEKSLIREWEIDNAKQKTNELGNEIDTLEEIKKEREFSKPKNEGESSEAFENVLANKRSELSNQESKLGEFLKIQESNYENKDFDVKNLLKQSLKQTQYRVDEFEQEMEMWNAATGNSKEKSVGEKLDLASKLFNNDKIRKLARLVGSLKEEMLSARKKSWSRMGTEVFNVAMGNDIGRIIPSELIALRRPLLKIDFQKRFIENSLAQYYLKDDKGRGPLVICLDGSSSMEGKKELWSKGVCLTLLEIAKRERRKFNVVVFSSAGSPLKIFESLVDEGRSGWQMRENDVFELAEYFPGGGTNFEEPINKALEILQDSKFNGGDIVFITDGESNVGNSWLKSFKERKKRLKFKVYSVLIDLSERESWTILSRFSDKVTCISKLNSKEGRSIFIEV